MNGSTSDFHFETRFDFEGKNIYTHTLSERDSTHSYRARIASKTQLNDNSSRSIVANQKKVNKKKNEQANKRCEQRANDHGSRVLRRSINECICTRVPCNFMFSLSVYRSPSLSLCVCVYLSVCVFYFVHFHFAHSCCFFDFTKEKDGEKKDEYG